MTAGSSCLMEGRVAKVSAIHIGHRKTPERQSMASRTESSTQSWDERSRYWKKDRENGLARARRISRDCYCSRSGHVFFDIFAM